MEMRNFNHELCKALPSYTKMFEEVHKNVKGNFLRAVLFHKKENVPLVMFKDSPVFLCSFHGDPMVILRTVNLETCR